MTEILSELIEHLENRFYGKFRGTITDTKDPKSLGRIRVKIPELLGDKETGWALPCLPYGGSKDIGFFVIPEVGSNVWIEFESGNLSYPIWTGVWWSEPSSGNEVPSEAQKLEPAVKILKTKAGHKIELHDTEGQEKISVTSKDGSNILMDSKGIKLSADNGNSVITIDSQGIILSKGSNSIKITNTSVIINDVGLEVM